MDGKILMDFRRSKGCGLEFKKKFIKLKQCLGSIVQQSDCTALESSQDTV